MTRAKRGAAAMLAAALFAVGVAPGASASSSSGDSAQGGSELASPGIVVNYPAAKVPMLPKFKAGAFVVANADNGQVLAAKDAHGWFRPASTLKVLTAISLIPLLNPDATTVASKAAADTEPNDVGLIAGHSYKISDLFTALLTISANDAAVALTQATGSFSKGMAVINEEAHELQADDTVAVQPNGLDAPGQHTSAYDEALIARRALQIPAFLGYDRTKAARFELKPKKWVTLVNQNLLLTGYPGDVGGKLGWTRAAGATYMGMAERNGVTLIVTLLHCPPLTEFNYAAKLLNWGFAVNGKVKPVGTLVGPLPPPAPEKPSPKPRRHKAAAAEAVASASFPYGQVGIGLAFLAVFTLIVTGAVVYYSRKRASAQR